VCEDSVIRIFHLDPCDLVRHGLSALLASCHGMTVAGSASTATEALAKCSEDEFDVLLTELFFPDRDGRSLLAEFRLQKPDLPIVVLTHREGDKDTLMAFRTGVKSVLTKGVELQDLTLAIRAARDGSSYLPSNIASTIVQAILDQPDQPAQAVELSERDRLIIQGVVDGMGNADIAAHVRVSVSTVKTTLRRLFKELQVSSRTELVATAIQTGLV